MRDKSETEELLRSHFLLCPDSYALPDVQTKTTLEDELDAELNVARQVGLARQFAEA
jgi:hypothetical protein